MGQKKGVFQEGRRPQWGPVQRGLEKPALGSSLALPTTCWVTLDKSLNFSESLSLPSQLSMGTAHVSSLIEVRLGQPQERQGGC